MRSHSQAFTLVELAVAILVLAVGLTAVLSVASYSMRETQEIIQETGALNVAQSVLDSPTWPLDEWKAMNGFEAHLESQTIALPIDPNDSTREVPATKYIVTVRSQGREVLKFSRIERQ